MTTMDNDIFKTTMKHTIYEMCIDILFNHIKKNFPKHKKRVPSIGEKFVKVLDKLNGETYYQCQIIKPTSMEYYDELEADIKNNILIAMHFAWNEYDGAEVERNEDQYFTETEFEELTFIK